MANQSYQLTNTPVKVVKVFTGDTADSASVKFDLSTFPAIDGKAVTRFGITKVKWACSNGFSVGVLFDRSSASPARPMILAGVGEWQGLIKDNGTGNTGDIQFTTAGTAGTYWVEMEVLCLAE